MTDEEKVVFCGTICMAARRMGIYGAFRADGFYWFDVMAKKKWKIPLEKERKDTLLRGCESLVNYLNPT